ncbi:MAG: hypothetical protein ACW98K_04470 [Candidatus Kariarchaeaceae archaeon]
MKKPRRVTSNHLKKPERKTEKEENSLAEELTEQVLEEVTRRSYKSSEIGIQRRIKEIFLQYGLFASAIAFIFFITVLFLLVKNELQIIAFFFTILVLVLFIAGVGIMSDYNSWKGVVIDKRNKISLSLLQGYIWLFIILSGFIVSSTFNWVHTEVDLTETNLDIYHIALIALATISPVGSKYIKNLQVGILHENDSVKDVNWEDLFMGELKTNNKTTDLGKIQLFLISVLAWVMYFFALMTSLNDANPGDKIADLPSISGVLIPLLTLSHAGYLVSKALSTTNRDYLPNPPRNLRFEVSVNPDRVVLFWEESIQKELVITEYEIYRKTDTVDLDFQRIHQLSSQSSPLEFEEALADENVRNYKIKARNDAGFSEDSNTVQVKKN